MPKKILVILAHPQRQSYCSALAQAYADGARAGGAEVRELVLAEMQFDAIHPARPEAAPEPDVLRAQELVRWAEHLVFVYPILWGTIPAILKGFFERVFTPGFAVNFRKDSPLWDKLLKGRSARLIATLNTPPLIYRLLFGACGHVTMKRSILGFCGVSPVRVTDVGPMGKSTEAQRNRWIEDVRKLGAAGR